MLLLFTVLVLLHVLLLFFDGEVSYNTLKVLVLPFGLLLLVGILLR